MFGNSKIKVLNDNHIAEGASVTIGKVSTSLIKIKLTDEKRDDDIPLRKKMEISALNKKVKELLTELPSDHALKLRYNTIAPMYKECSHDLDAYIKFQTEANSIIIDFEKESADKLTKAKSEEPIPRKKIMELIRLETKVKELLKDLSSDHPLNIRYQTIAPLFEEINSLDECNKFETEVNSIILDFAKERAENQKNNEFKPLVPDFSVINKPISINNVYHSFNFSGSVDECIKQGEEEYKRRYQI